MMVGAGTLSDVVSCATEAEMVGIVMEDNSFSSSMVAGSRDSYSVMIVLLSSSARQGKPSAALVKHESLRFYFLNS